jgi:hypothetical protein
MPRNFSWKPIVIGGAALAILGRVVVLALSGKKPAPPKRVALIGDSYAVGLGLELAKLLPDFKYAGVKGTNTSQWAHHNLECGTCGDWLTAFKPDVVLVSLGVNDGASPNLANYQTIVRRLHGTGAKVVWIEPPAAVKAPAARAVIASLGVPTIPAPVLPMANALHPQSYAEWAQKIAAAVA